MVEFALMAPVLLFMLFAIIDFGRAIYYENALTNAAREGSRIAVLASNPCNAENGASSASTCGGEPLLTGPNVCDAIQNEGQLVQTWSCTDSGTIPGSGSANNAYVEIDSGASLCANVNSTTTPRGGPGHQNDAVKVKIVYYYRPLTPFLSSYFPSTFTLSSSACSRAEY